jgi:hypothetical protein
MISNEQDQITEKPAYTREEIQEIVKMVSLNYTTEACFADPRLLKKDWKNMISMHCRLNVQLGAYYRIMV